MFGYIRPYEDEMKVKQLKLYRCLYCGLCRSAGKHISIFSRFFLSYDYTLFAAVRMIFENTPYTFEEKRCGWHLFSKKKVVADNNVLALSSAIFSILTYYKIKDNIKDESFIKSVSSRIILPIAAHMRKKALKKGFSDAEAVICDCMEKIEELEQKTNPQPFELAEAFGEMMGYLLKLGLPEKDREDAYTVGFETGCFIYNADALDDLAEDESKGRFNPYLREYGDSESALDNMRKARNTLVHGTDIAADIISARMNTANGNTRELCGVVQNILYLGCPNVIDGILCKSNCKKCSKTNHRKEKYR